MSGLVHGICRLVLKDGTWIPSLGMQGVSDPSALTGHRFSLHAFATTAEADAFRAGVSVHASNTLTAFSGYGRAGKLVLIDHIDPDAGPYATLDAAVTLIDHGAAAEFAINAAWSWLKAIPPRIPDHRIGEFHVTLPSDGRPPILAIDRTEFEVSGRDGLIRLSIAFVGSATTLAAKLAEKIIDQNVALDIDCDRLSITLNRDVLRAKLPLLKDIQNALWATRYEAERAQKRQRIRQDRQHCRIVEHMLAGATLFNSQGRPELRPPPDRPDRTRTLAYSLRDRLLSADLIRIPEDAKRRRQRWGYAYEVGDLTDSGVRPPTPTRARPTP